MNKYKERPNQKKLNNKELKKLVERLLLTGKEDEEFDKMEEVFFHQRPHYR